MMKLKQTYLDKLKGYWGIRVAGRAWMIWHRDRQKKGARRMNHHIETMQHKKLDITDISGIDYDIDGGVLWLVNEKDENIFMVCLDFQQTHDSECEDLVIIYQSCGYQVVDLNDCAEDWGMCGDHNEGLYGSSMHENFGNAFEVFKSYMREHHRTI